MNNFGHGKLAHKFCQYVNFKKQIFTHEILYDLVFSFAAFLASTVVQTWFCSGTRVYSVLCT